MLARASRSELALYRGRPEDVTARIANEWKALRGALARYRSALAGLERADAHLFVHAAHDRVGQLVGGDDGIKLRGDVRLWLAREGVRDPDRMLQMMLPAARPD